MRALAVLLLTLLLACAAHAQREQDFSSRFMSLYGKEYNLSAKTVSPKMMERIMQLKAVEDNEKRRNLLSQIKSFCILSSEDEEDAAQQLRENAIALAEKNERRYQPYKNHKNVNIYVRKRAKYVVEVVMIAQQEHTEFRLINITGNLSDDFIERVLDF